MVSVTALLSEEEYEELLEYSKKYSKYSLYDICKNAILQYIRSSPENKEVQELLEGTHAHLEFDQFGLSFVRYFGNAGDPWEKLFKYKHIIPESLIKEKESEDLTLVNIVKDLLYESDWEYHCHLKKMEERDGVEYEKDE